MFFFPFLFREQEVGERYIKTCPCCYRRLARVEEFVVLSCFGNCLKIKLAECLSE